MEINEYQELSMKTLNPNIKGKDILINAGMGLCGEAGEVIDMIKKHIHQGHPLNKEALAYELGDVAWYLAEAAYALGYSLEDICKMNIDKLQKRYPNGFNTLDSINNRE